MIYIYDNEGTSGSILIVFLPLFGIPLIFIIVLILRIVVVFVLALGFFFLFVFLLALDLPLRVREAPEAVDSDLIVLWIVAKGPRLMASVLLQLPLLISLHPRFRTLLLAG